MSAGIAIVIESLGGGGAQHVASTLANAWSGAGYPVTVITFRAQDQDVFKLNVNVGRVVIGGSLESPNAWTAAMANLRRIWRLRAALKAARLKMCSHLSARPMSSRCSPVPVSANV